MDDAVRQVVAILKGIWLKRWIGLAVAWVVGIGGVVTVLSMPDKYEASARIYVDTQSVLKPLMAGLAVQPNVDQQIAILSRTLMSRPNMEKLIRMADMDLKLKTKEDKDRLIDDLLKSLRLDLVGANLYLINYQDRSPEKAKRLVQSLMTIFVESGMGDKRKDTDTARKFIEEQIASYQKRLEEAENRLKEFKLRNMTVAGENKDYFARAGVMSAQLEQAKLELREAQNARDALRRELSGEEPTQLTEGPEADTAAQISVPEIDSRIDALKRSLDALLQKYTEQHPDVVGAKKVIAQLEEQKKQELKARAKSSPGKARTSTNANPVYQQLKVNLAETESTIASLQARVQEYESRVAQMKASARLQPELETEFAQLNRDYDINKLNYNQLVSRRESASMAEQMEATSGVADFRIIDPPRVSPKPVAPNRLLLLPVAFLAALGAGVAVAFLISQVRPTFMDGKSLRDISGLPLLGSITILKSETQLRQERRRLMYFFGGVGGLAVLFGAAMVLLFFSALRV